MGQGLPPVESLLKILAENGRDTRGFAKKVVKKSLITQSILLRFGRKFVHALLIKCPAKTESLCGSLRPPRSEIWALKNKKVEKEVNFDPFFAFLTNFLQKFRNNAYIIVLTISF